MGQWFYSGRVEGRLKLDIKEEICHCEGDEALQQIVQGSCPIPRELQVKWDRALRAWSSGMCPCRWQEGWNQVILKVWLNSSYSVV